MDADDEGGDRHDDEQRKRRPVLEREPDADEGEDQPGIGRVPNPAVRAALDHCLVVGHPGVDGEEPAKHEHRPLPERDPSDHED